MSPELALRDSLHGSRTCPNMGLGRKSQVEPQVAAFDRSGAEGHCEAGMQPDKNLRQIGSANQQDQSISKIN